jgi:ADP-ribose pyrophosphatase
VEPWAVLGERSARGPAGWRQLTARRVRLPDGSEAEWDLVESGPTVCVLALTPEGQVVLARQFRPGPGVVLDELPGGMVDPGEDPGAAAARELEEETGYRSDAVEVVATTWRSASDTGPAHVAVALGCRRVGLPQQHGGEFCEVVVRDLADFVAQVRAGAMTDVAGAYLALDHLGALGEPALPRA